ncbi:hypothetical protein HN51_048102 [Arachis hypogaea]
MNFMGQTKKKRNSPKMIKNNTSSQIIAGRELKDKGPVGVSLCDMCGKGNIEHKVEQELGGAEKGKQIIQNRRSNNSKLWSYRERNEKEGKKNNTKGAEVHQTDEGDIYLVELAGEKENKGNGDQQNKF